MKRKKKPPNLAPLKDALIRVECAAGLFIHEHQEASKWFVAKAAPFPVRLPISEAYRETRWAQTLVDFSYAYTDLHSAIEQAIELVPTPEALDGDAKSPADRWTVKTRIELRQLAGMIHWTIYGRDGLGYLRGDGVPPLPSALAGSLRDIAARRLLLLDLVAEGVPPETEPERPPAKHPSQVTEEDKLAKETRVAIHLRDHPETTRDDAARALRMGGGTLSNTNAWMVFAKARKQARAANRAMGRGGDADLDSLAHDD